MKYRTSVLPTDIYVKLFDDADIKEKIRILSLSKDIRDAIYAVYGGEQNVNQIIRADKKQYIIKSILSNFKKKRPDTINFAAIYKQIKENNIDYDELVDPTTGKTMLMFACEFAAIDGARDIAEAILTETHDRGEEPDNKGRTALMYAVSGYKLPRLEKYRVNTEIIDSLLDEGASLTVTDNRGLTAVEHANTQSALDVLENHDADPQAILDQRIILSREYDDEDFDY